MRDDDVPAVEEKPLPESVLRVLNPILRTVLRSPAHRAFSKNLMLLHVTGRRTGHVYVVPVGRHEHEGQLVASAGGGWRRNLKGGADCDVTLDGQRRHARGLLVDDPEEVAVIFSDLLAAMGRDRANRLGLRLNVDRHPTLAELGVALADRNVVRLTLT